MSALREAIEHATLGWVKPELDTALHQVQGDIETYVEAPGDVGPLRDATNQLRQIEGTLRMLELYAPATLIEEMHALTSALSDGEIADQRDEACAALGRAAIQLPDYLERLQSGHRDIPVVLLPLLNELRGFRGESALGESVLFSPDFERPLPKEVVEVPEQAPTGGRELLDQYEGDLRRMLNEWQSNADISASLLKERIDGLFGFARDEDMRRLLWVASETAQAMDDGALDATRQLREAFNSVIEEVQASRQESGLASGNASSSYLPVRKLLQQVARIDTANPSLDRLRDTFGLHQQTVSAEELAHAQSSVTGVNRALLDTVTSALKEDVFRVKDSLDLHLRTGNTNASELVNEVEALSRISDTLGMLGLGGARDLIQRQRDLLAGVVQGDKAADESVLLDVAGALLFVDASLEDQVAQLGREVGRNKGDDSISTSDAEQLLAALTREAVVNFGDARQAFVAFVETGWDHAALAEVPKLLNEVSGALGMLELPQSAEYVTGIRLFTENELIQKRRVPGSQQLDTFADAIASVEYYLEALRDKRADREDILAITQQSLEALRYWPLPSHMTEAPMPSLGNEVEDAYEAFLETASAAQKADEELAVQEAAKGEVEAEDASQIRPWARTDATDSLKASLAVRPELQFDLTKDDIDDEIREIFVEEFKDEIENLSVLLPAWREAPGDADRLRPIRRVFHTLKGSGRLVGATKLGEFSWKIENMLNRVLDGSRLASPEVVALVDAAMDELPALYGALRNEAVPEVDLAGIEGVADQLANGEDVTYARAAAEEVVEVAAPTHTPVQIDPVLLEILSAEVQGHMVHLDEWLARQPAVPDEAVVRAVHTMNGAFSMAEVPGVSDAASPAEAYLKRLKSAGQMPSEAGVQALNTLAAHVRESIVSLQATPQMVPLIGSLEDQFVALRDALPAPMPEDFGLGEDHGDVFDADEEASSTALADAEAAVQAEADNLELERIAAEFAESERLEAAAEQIAPDQTAAEQAAAEQAAAEQAAAEQAAAEQAAAEQAAAEQAAAEQAAAEQAAAEQAAAEQAAAEQAAAEQAAAEQAAAEQAAAEQAAAEQAAAEQAAAEQAAAEQAAAEQAAAEQAAAEQAAAEQAAAEQAAAEQAAAEQAAAEQAAAEQAAAEQAAAEQAAAEQAAAEQAAAEAEALRFAAEQAEFAKRAAETAPLEDISAPEAREKAPAFQAQASASTFGVDIGPAHPLDASQLDLELLDIFTEECNDILDNSDGLLVQLRDETDTAETIKALQRDLHTLKGGARMAGIMSIGDLGHSMESLLEAVADKRTEFGADTIPLLERGLDTLRAMSERVMVRQSSTAPNELIAAFNARARGVAFDHSAAAVVEQTQVEMAALSAPAETALDKEAQAATTSRGTQEQVRIRADLLDRLVNYAGEVAIYRSRLEQQLGAFRSSMGEMEQTNLRLRDQLRRLDLETEAQIVARYQREHDARDPTFDPLELDRFSTLQQLTRGLNESANDMSTLQATLEDLTRQYETLLLQQSRVSTDLQEGLMRTRMIPFDSVLPRLRRVIRQAASDSDKEAKLAVHGAQSDIDRNVLERMTAPLEHLLRNAVAHGIEAPTARRRAGKSAEGTINVQIKHEGSEIVMTISDDGAGLNYDAIRKRGIERGLIASDAEPTHTELASLILSPGFSTAKSVSQLAGRGVGMDVVDSEVRQLGGSMEISSEHKQGTQFTLRLPQTLAVTPAVFVRIGETSYAVPIASVQGVSRLSRDAYVPGESKLQYGGAEYTVHDLGLLLNQAGARADEQLQIPMLLVGAGDLRVAVGVDQIIGNREIVVKPVGPQVGSIPGIFGATVMGDGSVVVILDVVPLARRFASAPRDLDAAPAQAADTHVVPVVMVVDDSVTMRKVTGRVLERQGYEVLTAKDGIDALERMAEQVPDLMLLDIEMPRMDGYELATEMRRDPRLRNVPIIMITSRTGEKHRERAFDIGVNRYLGKPYQEPELLKNVNELLEQAREQR